MARYRLDNEEFTVLAAAIGVIGDRALRKQIATKIKSAIKPHAPERWRGEQRLDPDWNQWRALCRVKASN